MPIRTILTHENSQALTAHPSTRREIPTTLIIMTSVLVSPLAKLR